MKGIRYWKLVSMRYIINRQSCNCDNSREIVPGRSFVLHSLLDLVGGRKKSAPVFEVRFEWLEGSERVLQRLETGLQASLQRVASALVAGVGLYHLHRVLPHLTMARPRSRRRRRHHSRYLGPADLLFAAVGRRPRFDGQFAFRRRALGRRRERTERRPDVFDVGRVDVHLPAFVALEFFEDVGRLFCREVAPVRVPSVVLSRLAHLDDLIEANPLGRPTPAAPKCHSVAAISVSSTRSQSCLTMSDKVSSKPCSCILYRTHKEARFTLP